MAEDPGLQHPDGDSQGNSGVYGLLESLREAIYNYKVYSQPSNPS